ncbi:MAG: FAD-binding oxidoreductase [Candidatus Dormibacteria bacterium]
MAADVEKLRTQVHGEVVTASDAGYDDARAVHNGAFDKRPLVVLRAADGADVVAGVNFARENGLDLSVRGGGHSAPGFGTNDGGVVIDLESMHDVNVDAAAQTASVGGGATLAQMNDGAHAYKLATTGGIVSTTGVGGLTLGGGIGYLTRAFGLTLDNLLSADVVLADGTAVTASESDHPDLFWALRGGGGNFGVVTSFKFQLHPVDQVFAGPIFYNLEDLPTVFRFFDEFITDAPEQFGGFPACQKAPPLPFIPEDRHGDPMALVVVHWAGPLAEADKVLKPFREVAPIVADGAGPLPYPALNGAFDAIFPKGIHAYWKAAFVNELSDDAIAVHAAHCATLPNVSSTMHLYPINGAAARVAPDATAFAYRGSKYGMVILSAGADDEGDAPRRQWVRDYYDALTPYTEPGGYINFMQDDDADRIRDNYRQNFDRLVAVKRTYDPHNLFHMNQNIKP